MMHDIGRSRFPPRYPTATGGASPTGTLARLPTRLLVCSQLFAKGVCHQRPNHAGNQNIENDGVEQTLI